MGIIRYSSELMLVLINDILDLSKIEKGKLELVKSQFDIRSIIESTIDVLGQQALAKGLDIFVFFDSKIPHMICQDQLRFRQIVLNLLSNAVKFTDFGHVILSVRMIRLASGESRIRILVSDSGVGIPKNLRSKLFQKFSQVGEIKHGGTGLGLAISKSLVEMMGGSMWIADDESVTPVSDVSSVSDESPTADTRDGNDENVDLMSPCVMSPISPSGRRRGSKFAFEIPCEGSLYAETECPSYLKSYKIPPFNNRRCLLIKRLIQYDVF